jgi:hypothetical protein
MKRSQLSPGRRGQAGVGRIQTDDGARHDGRRDNDVGTGFIGLLAFIVLVLLAAAHVKYLFFH